MERQTTKRIAIITEIGCAPCKTLKNLMVENQIDFEEIPCWKVPGIKSVPQLIIDGNTVNISPRNFTAIMQKYKIIPVKHD